MITGDLCIQCGKPITKETRVNFYKPVKYCSSYCGKKTNYETWKSKPHLRLNKLASMAKNRAKKSGVDYNIDGQHLLDLWNNNDGKCCLTGIKFDLGSSEKGKVNPHTVSVDRIVPSKGYTIGNVRLICYQVNIALSEFGEEQLKSMCEAYLKYNGLA